MPTHLASEYSTGLFGIYRWLLASMVAAAHLAPEEIIHIGYYAVFAFFTLSGYLMTLVWHSHYKHLAKGFSKYLLNRFLRIYPVYFIILLASIFVVWSFPEFSQDVHYRFKLPSTFSGWIDNFIIISLTDIRGIRPEAILIPPSWSLSIEIFFWMLLPFLTRSRLTHHIFIIFSLCIAIIFIYYGGSLYLRYFSPFGGALAFAAGSWLALNPAKISPLFGWVALFSAFLFSFFAHLIVPAPLYEGLYMALALQFFAIIYLSQVNRENLPAWFCKCDKILGDLSYPIFLVHILTATVIMLYFPNLLDFRSYPLFIVSIAASSIVSAILLWGVDAPIQRIRKKVRAS